MVGSKKFRPRLRISFHYFSVEAGPKLPDIRNKSIFGLNFAVGAGTWQILPATAIGLIGSGD